MSLLYKGTWRAMFPKYGKKPHIINLIRWWGFKTIFIDTWNDIKAIGEKE
jgi:hypothetical protein